MKLKFLILFLFLNLIDARADALGQGTIQILRKASNSDQISGLQFTVPQATDLETNSSQNPPVTLLNLKGTFKNRGATSILAPENVVVTAGKDESFSFKVRISGEATSFNLTEVDPLGEVKTENIQIYNPPLTKFSVKKPKIEKQNPVISKYIFTPGFSLTRISYQESSSLKDAVLFSELALTLKGSIVYIPANSNWNYGLSGYFTALPVGASIPNVTIRFLGINARAGYVLSSIKDPWKVNLMFGYYFTSMLVSAVDADSAFGYRNISGPQIFPTVSRLLKNDKDISGYFKFSPISARFSLLSIKNNEIAFGLAYGFILPNAHRTSISLDLSHVALEIPSLNEFKATSSSYSVGMNYTL